MTDITTGGVRHRLVVYVEDGEARFGWRAPGAGDREPLHARDPGSPTLAAAAPKTRPLPAPSERSAPPRPKAGGKCAAIWDYLDAHPMTSLSQLREAAVAHGWNVNNASCELYAWRRANRWTERG
jgi:hypothetical protein